MLPCWSDLKHCAITTFFSYYTFESRQNHFKKVLLIFIIKPRNAKEDKYNFYNFKKIRHNFENLYGLKERYYPPPHGNVSEKHVNDIVERVDILALI